MNVGVVGENPAATSVEQAVDATQIAVEELASVDVAVVTGTARSDVFETANRVALDASTPWFALELGGIGGYGVVDAAVTGFEPETACYRCLVTRVAANLDEDAAVTETGHESGRETRRETGHESGRETRRETAWLAGAIAADTVEAERYGTVTELPHRDRLLVPVPGCPVCDTDRSRSLSLDDDAVDLDDAITLAERAVDERIGLIALVGERESFPLPYYIAELTDTTGYSDVQAARHAAGVSTEWDEAFMKALGESLERYSAGVYQAAEFLTAPSASLERAVDPAAFVAPTDADVDKQTPIEWVPGVHLATGDGTYLPAEVVHFPPPTERIRPSITTGLGLGSSTVDALLSGLYEVIERDATMLSWYSTFEPLGLTVDDDGFQTLARRARSENLSVSALLVTQDVDIPVVAAAVYRDDDWPKFAAGSSASLDPTDAATAALEETLQNWMELRAMGPEQAASEAGAIGTHAGFPRDAREFVSPTQTIPSTSVGPGDVPGGRAELDELLSRVADAGLDPYAASVTPRDVDWLGFEAVRVVIPSAQPLFTGDSYFGTRAETVPRDLGFEPALDRGYHPFP